MSKLYIAEKPSVAKAIAGILGIKNTCKGFYETKTGDVVTYCFGHLMELASPDEYLAEDIPTTKSGSKVWREQDLPIIPTKWKLKVKDDCKAQFQIIKKQAAKTLIQCIVNCGDPDREGQLLVDEVLSYFGNKKPVLRYWAAAVDDATVKSALNNLLPNDKYKGMRYAALGRSHADWLIGMNATRAFTLAGKRGGSQSVLSVGRVQTPTLNLVATRDEQILNFKPQNFYVFKGSFKCKGQVFFANLKLNETMSGLDSEGRLVDLKIAQDIFNRLKNEKKAKVISCESKDKTKNQPLVYSLADIQAEANSKFGYSAEQILNICQSLYEKYKLTTYPRSDCEYLPTVQFTNASKVLNSLKQFLPGLSALIEKADTSIKSKVWNDSKISAHHGIIPTQQISDISVLQEDEKNVYMLIVKRYLCQFFPAAKLLSTTIKLALQDYIFECSGSILVSPGYKVVLGADETEEKDESQDKDDNEEQSLPRLAENELVEVLKIDSITAQTKPPASFTEGSLIKAMQNIYSFVDNPAYKKILKDGDGIGTSATRAGIIAELKKKGFLVVSGKKIKASDAGKQLLKELPDLTKNPVLTAMFESQLKLIEEGKLSYQEFENKQKAFATELVNKAKSLSIKVTIPTASSSTNAAKKPKKSSKNSIFRKRK